MKTKVSDTTELKIGILGTAKTTVGMDFCQVLSEEAQSRQVKFDVHVDNRAEPSLMHRIRELAEKKQVKHVVLTGYEAYVQVPAIQDSLRDAVLLLNPIELTSQALASHSTSGPVGILGARSERVVALYRSALAVRKLGMARLEGKQVEFIHRGIEHIRKGEIKHGREQFMQAANGLIRLGAKRLIVGCSEVRFALRGTKLPVILVDPAMVVAEEAIRLASTSAS